MHYNRLQIPALLILLLVTACGSSPVSVESLHAAVSSLAWPAPPAEPKIRLVRSIISASDLGIKPPLFRRIINRITGNKDEHFVRPTGIAQHEGIIYVADIGAQALWILDPAHGSAIEVRQAGADRLVAPASVAIRDDGAVFVADSWAKRVYLLDRHGKFLGIAAEKELQRPAGLAYDGNNDRLYVADSAAHDIAVFDSDGKRVLSWGRRGSIDGEFNYPTHISIDPQGRILVTDALNFRIQAFDQNGNFLWKFGRHGDGSGDFSAPKGVAMDSDGHVYVVDALFDSVQIFNTDGTLLLSFGEQGPGPGEFWLPGGIFIDNKDRIYVCDAYNHRIQIFEYIGGVDPPQQLD